MNHRSLIALPLALSAAIALAGTTPPTTRPGILDILSAADIVLVQRLGQEPTPHCEGELTDSLRFIRCYPVLDRAPSPGKDWNEKLGHLLETSATGSWHRECRYVPQVLVRLGGARGVSNLVVFTARCDSTRLGLLMIRPDAPMEYREMAARGEDLLDMLIYALYGAPRQEAVPAVSPAPQDSPAEGEFVYYEDEPTPVTRIDPVYPESARSAHIQGKVTLHVLVGEDGRVKSIKVIRGVDGLNEAAVDS